MKSLPTLFHKAKSGDTWQWRIWTEGNLIYTEHGIVGGQLQISSKKAIGKNTGKKNATSDAQQAELEAKSKHKNKLDRKYSLTPEEAQESSYLPMLAHEYEKKKKYVKWPLHFQPKLDGARALAVWVGDRVMLLSRNGLPYNVPHLIAELEQVLPKDTVLDGELYIHKQTFQTIISWIKKERPETVNIEYHVYDMPESGGVDDAPWSVRYENLKKFPFSAKIKKVKTYILESEDDIPAALSIAEVDGYEGIMLRNLDGLYLYDYRSSDLLKVKSMVTEEFKIVGYKTGDGKYEGACIWEVDIPGYGICSLVSQGTMEQKQEQLVNAQSYIGKFLTVRFQNRTDDGSLRFPVAMGFRPEEDLPKRN